MVISTVDIELHVSLLRTAESLLTSKMFRGIFIWYLSVFFIMKMAKCLGHYGITQPQYG